MLRRMNRVVVSVVLALTVPAAGCVPAAVGCVVAGSTGLVEASSMHHDHCGNEGCWERNGIAVLVAIVGATLLAVGGIDLAVRKNE